MSEAEISEQAHLLYSWLKQMQQSPGNTGSLFVQATRLVSKMPKDVQSLLLTTLRDPELVSVTLDVMVGSGSDLLLRSAFDLFLARQTSLNEDEVRLAQRIIMAMGLHPKPTALAFDLLMELIEAEDRDHQVRQKGLWQAPCFFL